MDICAKLSVALYNIKKLIDKHLFLCGIGQDILHKYKERV